MADVWSFDLEGQWAWTPIEPAGATPMPARHAHSVVWAHSRTVWIFGGMDAARELRQDLWELKLPPPGGGAAAQVAPLLHTCSDCSRPEARALHAAASDHRGTMWVFGGQTFSTGAATSTIVYLADLWRVRCRPAPDGSCASSWGA